jgi:pyruvate dehydrogenase E2 component (dihydrolipoamide acetyltransferase)
MGPSIRLTHRMADVEVTPAPVPAPKPAAKKPVAKKAAAKPIPKPIPKPEPDPAPVEDAGEATQTRLAPPPEVEISHWSVEDVKPGTHEFEVKKLELPALPINTSGELEELKFETPAPVKPARKSPAKKKAAAKAEPAPTPEPEPAPPAEPDPEETPVPRSAPPPPRPATYTKPKPPGHVTPARASKAKPKKDAEPATNRKWIMIAGVIGLGALALMSGQPEQATRSLGQAPPMSSSLAVSH